MNGWWNWKEIAFFILGLICALMISYWAPVFVPTDPLIHSSPEMSTR